MVRFIEDDSGEPGWFPTNEDSSSYAVWAARSLELGHKPPEEDYQYYGCFYGENDGAFGTAPQSHRDLQQGQRFTAKIAPVWTGSGAWFTFEKDVEQWLDICVLDPQKRGPALRNSLMGAAQGLVEMLDPEKLRRGRRLTENDKELGLTEREVENRGVYYFMRTVKKTQIRGEFLLFMHRMALFNKIRRPRGVDLMAFCYRFRMVVLRLKHSWLGMARRTKHMTTDEVKHWWDKCTSEPARLTVAAVDHPPEEDDEFSEEEDEAEVVAQSTARGSDERTAGQPTGMDAAVQTPVGQTRRIKKKTTYKLPGLSTPAKSIVGPVTRASIAKTFASQNYDGSDDDDDLGTETFDPQWDAARYLASSFFNERFPLKSN